jgi:hypothetical protein
MSESELDKLARKTVDMEKYSELWDKADKATAVLYKTFDEEAGEPVYGVAIKDHSYGWTKITPCFLGSRHDALKEFRATIGDLYLGG